MRSILVAIIFANIIVPAHAQFNGGMDWIVNRTRVPAVIQCPGCNDDADGADKSDTISFPDASVDIGAAQLLALNYTPSMQRRKSFLARVAKDIKHPSAGAIFKNGDIIAQIDEMIRPSGLSVNNVADAYAVWWIAAWEAVNKRDMGNSPTMYQAVQNQAAQAMLSSGTLAGASDAAKQEMAESLLIQAVLIEAASDFAGADAGQQTSVADSVNKGAKAMGLDLTKMTLTEDGFVPR